jgi:predicted RNA-binding protein with PIN domain
MYIIIDGYNLIRRSDSLRRFENYSLEEGRNELIRRLSRLKKLRGHKITVVFDGWVSGSSREERCRENGITVIYSRRGEKADEVIKRMAQQEGQEVLVVTSDRSVADAVTRSGGIAVASAEFEARVSLLDTDTLVSREDLYGITDDSTRISGKKKGPSRRLSKKKRKAEARLKKL